MNNDKLKPSGRKLFGVHVGGVSWVSDARWMVRAEHADLDDVALSAALRGQPWAYGNADRTDQIFTPSIQPLAESTQERFLAKLEEPENLVEFSHTGLSLGMEDDLRTNLFLSEADECRWVNAAFIRNQWEDCRFMSVPGGTEDSGSGACAIRVYGNGPDMLLAVIMPMLAPAACMTPLKRLGGILQDWWGDEEHESAERGE